MTTRDTSSSSSSSVSDRVRAVIATWREKAHAQTFAGHHGTLAMTLLECANELEAVIAHPQPQGWQPIETAPKDGTKILATGPGLKVTWWVEGEASRLLPNGVHMWSSGYLLNGEDFTPTHWMPLPSPPTELPVWTAEDVADIKRCAAERRKQFAAPERSKP